jgi:hypothetical protein
MSVCVYMYREGGRVGGREERGKEGGKVGRKEGRNGGGKREIEGARARTCKRRAQILLRNHAQAALQEPFPGIPALHASTNTRCEIAPLPAPPQTGQVQLTNQWR